MACFTLIYVLLIQIFFNSPAMLLLFYSLYAYAHHEYYISPGAEWNKSHSSIFPPKRSKPDYFLVRDSGAEKRAFYWQFIVCAYFRGLHAWRFFPQVHGERGLIFRTMGEIYFLRERYREMHAEHIDSSVSWLHAWNYIVYIYKGAVNVLFLGSAAEMRLSCVFWLKGRAMMSSWKVTRAPRLARTGRGWGLEK